MIGFVYPGALAAFALLPLLLVAWLVRERPSEITVSSVLGFKTLRALKAQRPWGLPRLDWLFLVELLILTLAVLAMAGPYITRPRMPVAAVLDNSAVMQVRQAAGGSWFDAARAQLAQALPLGPETQVTIFVTAPGPHQIAGPLSPAAARTRILKLPVSDAPADNGAVARLLSDLGTHRRFAQIFFASATSVVPPLPSGLHTIVVGAPTANYALGSFGVSAAGFGAGMLKARMTLANFSSEPHTLQVRISSEGKVLAHAQISLGPREIGGLEFPALPPASSYRAELEPQDAFALDNTAYATPASGSQIEVLFVTPTPADAAGLQALPGLRVRTVSPEQFSPDQARADLLIFEYSVPKQLPAANALLVMPPDHDPVFDFTPAPGAQVTTWLSPDPLTDGVNFRLLALRAPQAFAVHPWMGAVVNSNRGALIMAGSRDGHRYLAMGFDPFPYLGPRNLPMSILTLNILSYLSGFGLQDVGYRTGQGWIVPAGVSRIVTPSGLSLPGHPGTLFSADTMQGIYQLVGPGAQRRLVAINLADLSVSDLENPLPIKLEDPGAHPAVAPGFSAPILFTPWLVGLMLALAILEASFNYARRRRPARAAT